MAETDIRENEEDPFINRLDIFPKLHDEYVDRSTAGGMVSIATFLFIGFLISSEVAYYRAIRPEQTFTVDDLPDIPLSISLYMTVNMDCEYVGGDLVDASQWTMKDVSEITKTPTQYQLSSKQNQWMLQMRNRRKNLGGSTIKEVLNLSKQSIPPYPLPDEDAKVRCLSYSCKV